MGEKAKPRTYGRRPRKQDIVEALGTLTLSDDNRSPLANRSVNASTTLPAVSTLKKENGCSGTALDIIEPQTKATSQIVPQATETNSTVDRPDQPPQRRLRSKVKVAPRSSDGKTTEEDTYLKPLTAITDVEGVVQQFSLWAETMDKLLSVVMIGDGSYANVFKLASKSNPEIYSIAKLIPLRARRGSGSRSPDLTTVENAANEVQMLARMSGTKGFTDFKRAMLLQGQLPQSFRKACRAFELEDKGKKGRTQTSGQLRRLHYPKQQLWLFLEMGDAGEELETVLLEGLRDGEPPRENLPQIGCLTVQQTRDIFYFAVEALAFGERDAEFEHRDLHLSNVCLKWNERDSNANRLGSGWQLVPKASSVTLTLIDYTLSRAKTDEGTIFNHMDDEGLFLGEGSLQYDIYRHMRQIVGESGKLDWSAFAPRTNVMWLHYILTRLLEKTALTAGSSDPRNEEPLLLQSLQRIGRDTNVTKKPNKLYSSAIDVLMHMEEQANLNDTA